MFLRIRSLFRLLPQSEAAFHSDRNPAPYRRCCQVAPLALALALAGCGARSSSSSNSGLPTPAAAGSFNAYVGTSPEDSNAPAVGGSGNGNAFGLWSVSLDHAASPALFTAWDATDSGNNTDSPYNTPLGKLSGTVASSGGFLSLTQTNDSFNNPNASAGVAFEIPGRVAILRQGPSTMPITALVPSGCPSINGSTKFNFVLLPSSSPTTTWTPDTDPAYGSLSISNSGSTWNFSSFQELTLTGTAATYNGTVLPTTLPVGTCASTAVGTSVYVPWSWGPTNPPLPLPSTIAVGPSGFYLADQGADTNSYGYPGEFGVIQPSASLNTADILSHSYLGFTYESGADASLLIPESQMAYFTASTPAGNLSGGAFTNDDPTQPAATNLSINLGAQDKTTNGLYPNAVITNNNQSPASTYPAVAVVGNPEGKYAIFIIAEDTDFNLPLGIYLFQQ